MIETVLVVNRFIVRNSWGADWADQGYCYIPYNYAANPEFNFLGMYAIYGLTETDFTPESGDDTHALFERYGLHTQCHMCLV